MANGYISKNNTTISGTINNANARSIGGSLTGGGAGGGSSDHKRLINRDAPDQHPIGAISGLQAELDKLGLEKLDSSTAMPLIEEAVKGKAKGLYFDAMKELATKSFWYLTSEIDPTTKLGTKESIISGPYDLGAGGGGGGGGVTTVTIKPSNWPATVALGAPKTILNVEWSSTIGEDKSPTGNGTLYLIVNEKQVEARANQPQGIIPFDVAKYLVSGNNVIQIKVLDTYGTQGTTISTVNAVTLELKSNFDSDRAYTGTINYTYIPYGDIEKTTHFIIDGNRDPDHPTQIVRSTGESQTFPLTGLSHGSHTLEVYFTALIDGIEVSSNSLYYDLIHYAPGNETPIIASDFNQFEQEQYLTFNIPYRVYIYGKNLFDVKYLVNGIEVQSLTVSSTKQFWEYKNDTPGNYILTILCGEASKVFNVHINTSSVKVEPITQDLVLALSAQGRTNSDTANRSTWTFGTGESQISCTFNNFNWRSDGWVKDANGNTVLRVGGDARVTIPYYVFETDFKNRGKTIELEIATSSIRDYGATIISCLDGQTSDFYEASATFADEDSRAKVFEPILDYSVLQNTQLALGRYIFTCVANGSAKGWSLTSDAAGIIDLADYGISLREQTINPEGAIKESVCIGDRIVLDYSKEARGFKITPQLAEIRSQQSALSTQYKEDEHIRIAFVVEQQNSNRIIWMYLNGIASGAMQYPKGDVFSQLQKSPITIGSNNAVVDIYNIRIYDNALTSRQIVNSWIADTQDASLRASRFKHNDNYNDKNEIVISKLPIDLPYIIWSMEKDPLPTFKGDKRLGHARYVDQSYPERNFTSEYAQYNVQGTSSSVYPVKNIRIKYKAKDGDPRFKWINDAGDTIKKFPITYPDGVGDNYFTYKVDYASSEGANNVELTKLYNDACKAYGLLTPPQQKNSKVRVGIDGFPIAAFYQDNNGVISFCTKANFNNDKANEDVYGFDADYGDESWETTNNSAAETKYQVPITFDDSKDGSNVAKGFEIRFPDEDNYGKNNPTTELAKLKPMTEWVYSTYRELATDASLPQAITFKYKETIKDEDGSFSTTDREKTFTVDSAEYRLTKFKAELQDWFNVDSCLFYYLFTELFLMIDSRAKNAFPTFFGTREKTPLMGSDGKPLVNSVADQTMPNAYSYADGGNRWYWIPYDMDTAIGIDNKGKLTFDYNLEDTDQLDEADVYNGQDSVMWNNVRDAFPGELAAMYSELRNEGLVDYDYVESMFEAHQSKWSESIFNADAHNKYIVPLMEQNNNYLEMLQGGKIEQRKWWLYNRFKYIDSKYNAGDAKADFIQFRAYVNANEYKPPVEITPYADIYATVSFGNGAQHSVSKRAKRNEPITIDNTFTVKDQENDQETYIYSASQLRSIGDISDFHPDTVKIGYATRLQDLKVGGDVAKALPCIASLTKDTTPQDEKRYYTKSTEALEDKIKIGGYLIDGDGYSYTPVTAPSASNISEYYELSYVGRDVAPYKNTHLRELTVGGNTLLKTLDARNCINLGTGTTVAPDLSQCTNIEEVYFSGTKIKGIEIPDGGTLKTLHLPGTLTSLTIKNQPLLTDLDIATSNTTITRSLRNKTSAGVGTTFILSGLVQNKAAWTDTTGSAEITLADSVDSPDKVVFNLLNNELYKQLVEGESMLQVTCNKIDVRYDLVGEEGGVQEVTLAEIAARELVTGGDGVIAATTSNVSHFIRSIFRNLQEGEESLTNTEVIDVPTIAEYKISLIEDLWLEGIPATAIDTYKMIERMKKDTYVRIMGIDEDYTSKNNRTWEDLDALYTILDNRRGINADGEHIDKAQIQGRIKVDTIPYADYMRLSAKYPEVIIDPTQIICTITFVQDDGITVYTYQNVVAGTTGAEPEDPIKTPTQAEYYEFEKWLLPDQTEWTTGTIITTDITVKAQFVAKDQEYTATFETDSDLITVTPKSITAIYNSTLQSPALTGIPEKVEFEGWWYGNRRWVFENDTGTPTPLLENVTLVAKWRDETAPDVTISRNAYNQFTVGASDNLGIVAYAVTCNKDPETADWTEIPSTTSFSWEQQIDRAGTWSAWILDKNNNIKQATIEAHNLTFERTPGIEEINVYEGSNRIGGTASANNFALSGTGLSYEVILDSHYQEDSLSIKVDGSEIYSDSVLTILQDTRVTASCLPKDYRVHFVTGKEVIDGTSQSISEPDQIITYLHTVTHPASQYYDGEIIEAWYTNLSDETSKWIFAGSNQAMPVTGDLTLYAKWAEYRTPTQITIKLDTDGQSISLDYTQRKANSVHIDWGDAGDDLTPDANPEKFESSTETQKPVSLSHPYSKAGTYVIKIWGTKYGYNLGNSYERQVINPSSVIIAVDFAWDLANTADYAFLRSSITELHLTSYMKEVSIGAFAACNQLKSLTIPKNITILRDQAFSNCRNLEGTVTIPNTMVQMGNEIFKGCTSLESIVFESSTKLKSLGKLFCSECSTIKTIDIPAEIGKLGQYALANMSSLEKVILRNPALIMEPFVFSGDPKLLTAGPINSEAPGTNEQYQIEYAWTTHIPGYAFYQSNNARYLQEVTLPEGLESIGIEAFGDTNLRKINYNPQTGAKVNFPTSLKSIGTKAFYNTSLTDLVIPATVTDIGNQAFSYCPLSTVKILTTISDTKASAPEHGWFYGNEITELKPVISETLVAKPEENLLSTRFGPFWNAQGYDATENRTTYLMYSTFKED